MTARRWRGLTVFDSIDVGAGGMRLDGQTVTPDTAVTALAVHNASGGTLTAGTLVYLSGWNAIAVKFNVTKADADAVGKLATYVLNADIANGADGEAVTLFELTGQNTNAGNVGDPVYLSTTAGGWTLTPPSAFNSVVQVIGFVSVKSATVGKVRFALMGANRQLMGSNELQPASVLEAKLDPAVSIGLVAGRVWHGAYDFATDGGAQGTLALRGGAIPDKAIVYGGLLNMNTALAGASATAALQFNAANDLVSAAAISGAPWSTQGLKAIAPVMTAGSAIKGTAARTPSLVIGTANLTGGHFNLWLIYFVADAAS